MPEGALYIDLAHDEGYKALFRLLLNSGALVRSGELRRQRQSRLQLGVCDRRRRQLRIATK